MQSMHLVINNSLTKCKSSLQQDKVFADTHSHPLKQYMITILFYFLVGSWLGGLTLPLMVIFIVGLPLASSWLL